MKKIFLATILLLNTSCQSLLEGMACGRPPQYTIDKAKWLYENNGRQQVWLSSEEIDKIFGCYYYFGDQIYYYKSFFSEGYVLVRSGEAVYYTVTEDK